MRDGFTFFIFLFFPAILLCNNVIDSLLLRLESVSGKERVDVLIDLSWQSKKSDIIKSIEYGSNGLKLAEKLNYQEGVGDALIKLSIANSIQNNFEKSSQCCEKAIRIFQSLDDAKNIAACWNVMGINFRKVGNFEGALTKFTKALYLYETLQDTSNILKLEGNIANVFYVKGDYKNALKTYEKLIAYFEEIKNKENLSRFLGNAARIYSKQGKYTLALKSFFKANELLDSLGQTYEKANNLNNIGLIFFHLDMISEALKSYNEGLILSQDLKDTKRKADVYNNIGNCYLEIEKYELANKFFSKALAVCKKLNIKPVGSFLRNIARISIHKKDYPKALVYLNEANQLDVEIGSEVGIASNYFEMGLVYFRMNDLNSAISNLEKSLNLWQIREEYPKIHASASLLAEVYRAKKEFKLAFSIQDIATQASDSLAYGKAQSELTRVLVKRQLDERDVKHHVGEMEVPSNTSVYLLPFILIVILVIGGLMLFINRKKPEKVLLAESLLPMHSVNKQNEFLLKIDDIVEKEMHNSTFNVTKLTKILGTNRSQLNIKMKELTNLSPSKYIQNIRLEKAKKLLVETDMAISEIAEKTGYDASYFARVFSHVYGITPNVFRKKNLPE